MRQEQEANYTINQKKLGKYIAQVKQGREQTQADFTTADKILHGGGVQLSSVKQIAANHTKPQNAFEQKIHDELKRQGLNTEKDFVEKEMQSLKGSLDSKQLQQKYDEMARMKGLLFRQEIKNRRISKIKSKLFHKLKKKEREREEDKIRQYMAEVDPEAAKAYTEKAELKKVEERLRMRHGTGTKFAKNLKRFRGMNDQETRDAYHQIVLDRQALTKRTQKIGDSSESDSSEDSDASDLQGKAIKKMRDVMDEGNGSAHSEAESSDEDGIIKMDFTSKKQSDKSKPAQGITALKFMQRSELKQKEQLRAETEFEIDQINESRGFVDSANRFGKKLEIKQLVQDENQVMSEAKVIEAARRVTGQSTAAP